MCFHDNGGQFKYVPSSRGVSTPGAGCVFCVWQSMSGLGTPSQRSRNLSGFTAPAWRGLGNNHHMQVTSHASMQNKCGSRRRLLFQMEYARFAVCGLHFATCTTNKALYTMHYEVCTTHSSVA